MRAALITFLLALALVDSAAAAAAKRLPSQTRVPAFRDYQFGMTREEVRRVTACSPYQYVAGTAGLECPNLTVGARKINVSFVFKEGGLSRLQLWFYEGPSESAARQATGELLEFLSQRGALSSNELNGARPTVDRIFKSLRERNKDRQGARVQVLLPPTKTPPFVHASITRVQTGYYVFVFFTAEKS